MLLSLILQIDAWHGNRTYVGVFNDLQEEYARIQARFEKVTGTAARYFRLFYDSPRGEHCPSPSLIECSRNFREQCDELDREVCRFIAHGVLKSGWTRAERNRTFVQMGFESAHEIGETLNPNQVVTLVAMLFSVLLIVLTVAGSQSAIQCNFFISTMVASIYGAAIVAAVLLKGRWPRTAEERPVVGYLAAGITAVASAAALSVIFKSLLLMNFSEALLDLRCTYPYFALAFMAAAATSFLCDDYATAPENESRFTRWLEGLAAAGVLAGTAYFVWEALHNTAIEPRRIPRLATLLPSAALIGLIIGASVPTWYRAALRRRQANQIAAASFDQVNGERVPASARTLSAA